MKQLTNFLPASPLRRIETENNYAVYLSDPGIEYRRHGPYLLIGKAIPEPCWLIHISVIPQQMQNLIQSVLAFLVEKNVSFALPADTDSHRKLLDGRCGFPNIGKVITVGLSDEKEAALIALSLTERCKDFRGPDVATGVRLSPCVYVSYGCLLQAEGGYNDKSYSAVYGFNAQNALLETMRDAKVKWPFSQRVVLRKKRKSRLIGNQYLPIQALKNDAKGNVLKCIRLNKIYNMRWCVLKQGKKCQSFDDAGRDMKDRLRWQYHAHKRLEGTVLLPKVIEYFEADDDAYIAFEYIDGISLSEKVNELCQGTAWTATAAAVKREIIGYLLQIANILDVFHQNGFVHRDANPGNFLVTREGLVIAIDIELCCHLNSGRPDPPFILGTPGYMSPQQMKEYPAVIEDDLYGLGALCIKAFTGLSPWKFDGQHPNEIRRSLQFFIGCDPVSEMICACLDADPSQRPLMSIIRNVLESYHTLLLNSNPYQYGTPAAGNQQSAIQSIIQQAVKGLGSPEIWLSKIQGDGRLANESLDYRWSPGFASGTSGILHTLALAKTLGFPVSNQTETINHNLNYLKKETCNFGSLEPGLWQGSFGVAIAIASLVNSDLLENSTNNSNLIHQLISIPAAGINIADGIAGEGLCLLYCQNMGHFPSPQDRLPAIAAEIIQKQEKDGSWLLKKDAGQLDAVKVTGFCYGIAGIAYFLLVYYVRFKNEGVRQAIVRSLNWLLNNRVKRNSHFLWFVSQNNAVIEPWLEYGFSGISLTFIKAFEVLHNPVYKEAAVSALLSHPKYISSNYLSLANGLSGLGEVYLEAFRVFGDTEMQERAAHIAGFLLNTSVERTAGTVSWLDGNNTRPTPDLVYGTAGIIHFFMRYINAEKIGLPFQ